jgi:hypothetical protein
MAREAHTHDIPDELPEIAAEEWDRAPRQRSPRTDPSMRDGDNSHGNPYEMEGNDLSTDNDTGDSEAEPAAAGFDGGAVEGTSADMRGDTNTNLDDFTVRPGDRAELTGGDEERAEDDTDPLPHPRVDAGRDGSTVGHNAPAGGLPVEGYDDMTVKEVAELAKALTRDQVRTLREYEAGHRGRKTLLTKLDRMIGS